MEELLLQRDAGAEGRFRDVLTNRNALARRVYQHWRHGGFVGYACTHAALAASLALVLALLTLSTAAVDWARLTAVTELTDAVHWARPHPATLALLALMWAAWAAWGVLHAVEARHLWRVHCLVAADILPRPVHHYTWDEVAAAVAGFLAISVPDFETHLLREHQFETALVRADFFMLDAGAGRVNMLSHALLWAFGFAAAPLLDGPPTDTDLKAAILARRCAVLGAVGLALAPVLLPVVVVYYACRYAAHLRHQPGFVSSRHWSLHATLFLRRYTDTPHALRARLAGAAAAAEQYCQGRHTTAAAAALQFAKFVCSTGVVLILALAAVDDDALTRQTLAGRALLWWLGMLAGGFGVCTLLQRDAPEAAQPAVLLHDLAVQLGAQTEYLRTHMGALYEYRALGFAWELASVVLAPLFLLTAVRARAPHMLAFLHGHAEYVYGAGCVWRHVHRPPCAPP